LPVGTVVAVTRGEVFPIINCSDIAGMRTFYESVLGGELVYQFPDEGDAMLLVIQDD
jgi:lactoylglutathione lyase